VSEQAVPVSVWILGKEYRVSCPPSEQAGLKASAEHLSERMKAIRDSGKVFGLDRIAVMAALNIAHEMLQSKGNAAEKDRLDTTLSQRIRALDDTVAGALAAGNE